MGRRKKIEEPMADPVEHDGLPLIGETAVCPICGKLFVVTPEHAYISHGSYTCTWECFLGEIKRRLYDKQNTNALY